MSSVAIKPCPVCGSPRSKVHSYEDYWRICHWCKWATPPCSSAREANRKWNDRRDWNERKDANRA